MHYTHTHTYIYIFFFDKKAYILSRWDRSFRIGVNVQYSDRIYGHRNQTSPVITMHPQLSTYQNEHHVITLRGLTWNFLHVILRVHGPTQMEPSYIARRKESSDFVLIVPNIKTPVHKIPACLKTGVVETATRSCSYHISSACSLAVWNGTSCSKPFQVFVISCLHLLNSSGKK